MPSAVDAGYPGMPTCLNRQIYDGTMAP